nr:uncharacterized protein LOC107444505 isoform X1 [Parasteatoda tepidariorum]
MYEMRSGHHIDGESSTWKDVGWFALKTTTMSGAVFGGTALALPLIGFTAGGVAAGALAAGLTVGTRAAIVAGGVVIAGASIALRKLRKNDKTDSRHTSEEPSENKKENDVNEEAVENAELLKKNCKDPGLKPGSTNSARENKKFPMKLVFSYRNDDPSKSLELIRPSPINDN